jgi:hypothetical protein
MRKVRRRDRGECCDFGNREKAFYRRALLKHAVVELLASPIGGGLHEGQD